MAQIINFEKNESVREVMDLAKIIVNSVERKKQTKFKDFYRGDSYEGKTFKVEDDIVIRINGRKQNIKGCEVRLNSTVPSAELFSLAADLVRPADEDFEARNIFSLDTSFHEGSKEIGYDVVSQDGRARIVPTGQDADADAPKADIRIGRRLSPVAKIENYISVTLDEIAEMSLRTDRGLGPIVNLIQEKLTAARKFIYRLEDNLIFFGASLGDASNELGVEGFFDKFSTDSDHYSGTTPSAGQRETVAGTGNNSSTFWADKSAENIVNDIRKGVKYVRRNGAYKANTLVIDEGTLVDIAMQRTSEQDTRPILEWLKGTFQAAFGIDLKIAASNALAQFADADQKGGFVVMDSQSAHQAIASVQDITVLPVYTHPNGTIQQNVLLKTGGLQVKHPSAAYLGIGISNPS